MAARIKNLQTDIPILNIELARFDQHQQQISDLQKVVGQLKGQLQNSNSALKATDKSNYNNVLLTFDGAGNVSWPDSYTHSNGHFLPIPGGTLAIGTGAKFLWFGWNPAHNQMSAIDDVLRLAAIPTMIILGQVAADGSAKQQGLGGSEPTGQGVNGTSYPA